MNEHRSGQLALGLCIAIAVLAVAAVVLSLFALDQAALPSTILACIAAGAAFGPIGALVVRRRGNAVGWALLAIGGSVAVSSVTVEYAIVSATHHDVLPAWRWVSWAGADSLVFTAGSLALLLLLYPTGGLPSRRWRPVLWGGGIGFVGVAVSAALNPVRFQFSESTAISYRNPAGIEALGGAISVLLAIFGVMAITAGILCIASLVVRFRRGSSDDRERIKWLAYVAVAGVLFLFVGEILSTAAGCEVACGNTVFGVFFAAVALGVPVAVGAAILRHGLYDIEVVIRKTVVVAAIAVFFVVIYALVVGGVGALVQSSSSTALSFGAAALVAVLFQPVLARARRFADSRRVRQARLTVRGACVVLRPDGGPRERRRARRDGPRRRRRDRREARRGLVEARRGPPPFRGLAAGRGARTSGAARPRLGPAGDRGGGGGAGPPPRRAARGAGVSMPPSEPATDATRKLLSDLAGQAGLVLRNVRLIEELRASRKRLVTAQDEERRRLERNIHDGAQQQLVALKLRLRLAEGTVDKDPAATKQALAELSDATQAALDDLRDLARGIYPPLLADQGLVVALESQAKKSPVDVQLVADAIERYPQEIEAAVYFCSLEALQNVAKYAEATSATVRLWQDDGVLSFAVTDDGGGFDTTQTGYGTGLQGMADRLSALGGSLEVESQPGEGTTVTGRLPVA